MSDVISSSVLPKYYQLAEHLRQQIAAGQFAPGDQIDSEPALSKTHNLSRGTVRQAIQRLIDQGLLVRQHGRGTFVAAPPQQSRHFSLSSFSEEMQRQGRQPKTRLLALEVLPASGEVAQRLALPPETPVFHIRRLRLADDQPVAVETRYIARSLCPQLLEEDLEKASLHWLFVQKYGISLVRMEHTVEVQRLTAESAELLQSRTGASAFFVDRLTYTTSSEGEKVPAVWFQAIYAQDNYHIQTRA